MTESTGADTFSALFYGIDSSRVSLAEYRWGTPWLGMPFVALLKLLRVRLPSSTDEPNVEALAPFEVAGDRFPEEIRGELLPAAGELAAVGFDEPLLHAIFDPGTSTRIHWATFRLGSGEALARIQRRAWSATQPPKVRQFVTFVTAYADGGFRLSSNGKPDLASPPAVSIEYRTGESISTLWRHHRRSVAADESAGRRPVSILDDAAARGAIDRLHETVRDFHLARGVFVAAGAKSAAAAAAAAEHRALVEAEGRGERFAEEIAELAKLEKSGGGWLSGLLLLAISLAFFLGLGSARWSWSFVLLLVPILLVHELGHFVAMRLFDYRNVRMFFIPLFGAAVSGRNPQAPGWKRVLVSLAGPLPGIALALPLGLAGVALDQPKLLEAARLAAILNGFNLLPLLPLDGGWVMHTLLFSRHPLADVFARVLAVLGLFGLALLFDDRILIYLTIPILIALPANWKVAKATADLRAERLELRPGPDGLPPRATLERIFERLTAPPAKPTAKKLVAQQGASVLDSLGAEPPGGLATAGLLALYALSFIGAIVVFAILLVAGSEALLLAPPN